MTTTTSRGSRAWAIAGISSGALLLISTFLPFPTVTPAMLRTPSDDLVRVLGDDAATIYVRNGLSWLCIALLVVFVCGLYRHLGDLLPGGTTAVVALAGGVATAGALLIAYGLLAQIAAVSAEGRDPTVVASVYSVGDGLAYGAWTGLGLVTGAVAMASRHGAVGRGVGVFSAVVTAVFAAMAFFPFLAWAVAALWLIIAGVLFLRDGRASPDHKPSTASDV